MNTENRILKENRINCLNGNIMMFTTEERASMIADEMRREYYNIYKSELFEYSDCANALNPFLDGILYSKEEKRPALLKDFKKALNETITAKTKTLIAESDFNEFNERNPIAGESKKIGLDCLSLDDIKIKADADCSLEIAADRNSGGLTQFEDSTPAIPETPIIE